MVDRKDKNLIDDGEGDEEATNEPQTTPNIIVNKGHVKNKESVLSFAGTKIASPDRKL